MRIAEQRRLVLNLLGKQPMAVSELRAAGIRHPAGRVWELRRAGWPIASVSMPTDSGLVNGYVLDTRGLLRSVK